MRDLHHAIRALKSWRLGAAAAVVTLAIGIGTASSMYALMRVSLSHTIPDIDDLPALGRLYASSRSLGAERVQLTVKDLDLVATAASFESVGAYTSRDRDITILGQPVPSLVGEVSAGLFSTLRVHAAAGRLLLEDDFRGDPPVVVVSDRLWRTRFAGQSIGNAVATIDGRPRTIVGVLPAGAAFPFIGVDADAWMPLVATPEARARRVTVLARLKRGLTWVAAAAELEALARPQNPNGLWTWTAIPVEQDINQRAAGGLIMMFGPALIVLLIGCTNVACMLLARGVERDVELSVRSALGATRWRIVRQLLGENLVLALASGALGTGFAYALLRAIAAAMWQFRPSAPSLVPSPTALLLIAFGFSLAACVLFGTLPALRLSRRDLVRSLKGGTAPAVARFVGYRARDLIVFVELGIAVALVVTTAMFTRFFVELQRVTPSFPADRIVAVDVPAGQARPAAERVSAVPGVSTVTTVSDIPGSQRSARAASVRADNGARARATLVGADPSFFQAVGITVLRGRTFDRAEVDAHSSGAVVSEAAAALLWPGEDPVGARLTVMTGTGASSMIVVGVSRNALDAPGLMRAGVLAPDIYLPLDSKQAPEFVLLARTAGDPRGLLKAVAAAARLSPSSRLPEAHVLETSFVHEDSVFVIRLFGGFSILALLLAGSGIFGVISQSVAQRTTEFGVRMAMGASPGQVLRMVLVREGKLIGAAIGIGIVGTVLVTRSTFVELLMISGPDPRLWITIGVVCGGLAAVAAACATWRIVRLDPWKVLRQA